MRFTLPIDHKTPAVADRRACCRPLHKRSYLFFFAASLFLFNVSCRKPRTPDALSWSQKIALSAGYGSPVIDGSGADSVWESLPWHPLNYAWEGGLASSTHLQGRYKVAWDENNLYFLVEITDDTLVENTAPGLGVPNLADCLIIFLDEDASGGQRTNYNAFAYHFFLDGSVFEAMPDSICQVLDDHCWVRRISRESIHTWEIALRVYDGKIYRPSDENIAKRLKEGKKMGFAIAYGDRDGSSRWEDIVGNIPLGDKNPKTAWQSADNYLHLNLIR
ncbi:MAG: CBM9 family sugar-binding protein [Saprospiraceae bacterium]|nr:CBM9 family sugar-binding protein [Saprospiraceae bacterium]MDW8482849.1 sugar-binding protein [Saprospiraceae bacterium]